MNDIQPSSLNTKRMSYTHITSEQRNELSVLLRSFSSQKEIASLLDKDRITIWRELKRNGNGSYHARKAKEKDSLRRERAHQSRRKIENSPWLQRYIERCVRKKWSPQQISGRLKKLHPSDRKKNVGKDCIYRYIHTHRKDLVKHLRCQKGSYRRRYGTKIREKRREVLKKKRIDKRPKIGSIGHWEGDTIVGKDKHHILTHVDKISGYAMCDTLEIVTAQETMDQTVKSFGKLPKRKRQTITYDNGTTFAYHDQTEKKLNTDIYFAYPYHSWERGCNENFNGLLRQYYPKKTDLKNVSHVELKKAQKEINQRPRKRLNYATPAEIFYEKEEISNS